MKAQEQKKPDLKLPKLGLPPLIFNSSGASQFAWLRVRRSGGVGVKDACELAR
jgi:hypothetical protein